MPERTNVVGTDLKRFVLPHEHSNEVILLVP